LPREGFPPVSTPIVFNQTTVAGADAQTVDSEYVSKIDQAIRDNVDQIEQVNSSSFPNGGSTVVFLEESADVEAALSQMTEIVASLNFPENVRHGAIIIDAAKYNGEYDMLIAFRGLKDSNITIVELENEASKIADSILGMAEVEKAEVIEQTSLLPDGTKAQVGFAKFGSVKTQDNLSSEYASLVGLNSTEETDVQELSDTVNMFLSEYNGSQDTKVGIAADFAPQINNQIDSLLNNLGSGLLAVTLLTLVLIAVRASFVTALFIASVIAVTVGILFLIGYTINTISLFALVLALGLFVDDATIVVEAAERANQSKEKGRIDKLAVKRVAMASFAGTLTTVLVFLPLAFITGILGSFIRVMPVTISIALVVSLTLSLLVMPISFKYVFSRKTKRWVVARFMSACIDGLARFITAPYQMIKNKKKLGLAIGFISVLVSFVIISSGGQKFGELTFNIFPNAKDSDVITMKVDFDPNTNLESAKTITDKIDEKVVAILGDNVVDILYYEGNQRSASAQIDLINYNSRDTKAPQFVEQLESEIATINGVEVKFNTQGGGPESDDFPFKTQIFTENEDTALALAAEMVEFLDGKEIVRASGKKANIIDAEVVSLGGVVRRDGQVFVEVGAAFDATDTSALVLATQEDMEEEFNEEKLASFGLSLEDVDYDFGFESDSQDSFASLTIIGPLSLLAMYILLSFQFRSLIQPLLIFLAIPFSIFGVAYGLSLTNNEVSFFSMLGFLGLIGIAVNNTILLVDYANQERRKGNSAVDAITEATRLRMRPLITTTTTTALALTPLALSDPFWQPLAVTVIFGLISSTVLIILAFPYYYLATYWLRSKLSFRKMLRK